MKQRYFYLLFFLLIFISQANSQTKQLFIDLVGQKTDKWCWAASMEMAMNFFNTTPTRSQCEIVTPFLTWTEIFEGPIPKSCTTICEGSLSSLISFGEEDYSNTLPYNKYYTESNFVPAYFDLLFSNFGYFSMEDRQLLSWNLYLNEIDNCRPVIFMYSASGYIINGVEENNIDHAVVGAGYYIDEGNPIENAFIIIYDPLAVCQGNIFLLKKDALTPNTSVPACENLTINRLTSNVHHISPRITECDMCNTFESPPFSTSFSESTIIEIAEKNKQLFAATSLPNGSSLKSFLNYRPENHYSYPVYNLSYEKMNSTGSDNKIAFERALVETSLTELILSTTNQEYNLVAGIRCNLETTCCTDERIDLKRKGADQKMAQLPSGKEFLLSNDPKTQQPVGATILPYSIVRFEPYQFELYRFEVDGQFYHLPIDPYSKNYFYGNPDFEIPLSIKEETSLEGLSLYSKKFPWVKEEGKKWKPLEKLIECFGVFKKSLKETGIYKEYKTNKKATNKLNKN